MVFLQHSPLGDTCRIAYASQHLTDEAWLKKHWLQGPGYMGFQPDVLGQDFLVNQETAAVVGLADDGTWGATEVLTNEQRFSDCNFQLVDRVERTFETLTEDRDATWVLAVLALDVTADPIPVRVFGQSLVVARGKIFQVLRVRR